MQTSVETDPHTQTAESDPLSLGPTQEVQAVSVAGRFSSAQVYFVGPDAWIQPAIVVRLYGRAGGGRLLLSEVPLSSTIRTQENGTTTALAIVVQGIQVEGFEVVVAQGDGDAVSAKYGPTSKVISFPKQEVSFELGSAYGTYNWELFFHIPFTVAQRLSRGSCATSPSSLRRSIRRSS